MSEALSQPLSSAAAQTVDGLLAAFLLVKDAEMNFPLSIRHLPQGYGNSLNPHINMVQKCGLKSLEQP